MTREQRIVTRLEAELPRDPGALKGAAARAHSLPALLRRHGPVQALLFLAGKQGTDQDLATWIVAGISSAIGSDELAAAARYVRRPEAALPDYATFLAGLQPAAYLLRREAAVEVAGWLKLLIVARTEGAKTPAPAAAAEGRS